MPSVPDSHRAGAPPVTLALITCSDTRTEATDKNGPFLRAAAEALGHRVALAKIVPDEGIAIEAALNEALALGVSAAIFNGGTGIAPRDTTVDVLARHFERSLPGFGELFRHLSFTEIGSAAMLTRAEAGVVGETAVFCLPGSHAAVRLGWERLIAPELGHIANLLGG